MGHLPEDADQRSGYCSSNGIYYCKRPPVWIPENNASLDLLTFLFAPQFGDKVALIDAGTGRSLTYRELEMNVRVLAAALYRNVGVRQHDVVLLLSPNSIEFPVIFFAVTFLGGIMTTTNPSNTVKEIQKQMKDSGVKYIVTTAELLEKVFSANLPVVIVGSNDIESRFSSSTIYRYSDILRTASADISRPNSKLSDAVALPYSSGTSGISKGVTLTHKSYISAVCAYNSTLTGNYSCILLVLPMFNGYGFSACTLSSLARGATVVVLEKFNIETMLTAIQKYKVTYMPSIPPMVKALTNLDGVRKFDLSSLEQVASGAAPLGLDIVEKFAKQFPNVKLKQEYGMTETTACITTLPDGDDDHTGSCGILLPSWEARVVDPVAMQPVPPNSKGELWVRGLCIMKGSNTEH